MPLAAPYQIGCSLGYGDYRSVRVAADDARHDGCVDHSQILNPEDAELRVHNPAFSPFTQRLLVPQAGLQHARRRAKPRGRHMVPMRLRNTPLWLYFRSVRSSEKSVKL